MKGLLKILGVEFPKVHDVGEVFSTACREKGAEIEDKDLARLRQISARLAEDRAPSFYMERDYGAEEARQAKEDAEWIHELAKGLLRKLS